MTNHSAALTVCACSRSEEYPDIQLKGPPQSMCIAHRDTISGHFQCHRNSDLTRLKEKAYLSAGFVYLSNVLKLFSIIYYCIV